MIAWSSLSTALSAGSLVGGALGLEPARTRSPSANKALRMQALALAESRALAGDDQAYAVIKQWAGLVPNGTVPMAWPNEYEGPQGNGAWPGADGSLQAAKDAAARIAAARAGQPDTSLSAEGTAAGIGTSRLLVLALIGGGAFLAFRYFRKGA